MPQLKVRPPQPIDPSVRALPEAIELQYQAPNLSQGSNLERLAMATGSIGFGALVITIAVLSVQSRMSYITVENAIVNAKTMEVQSTLEGNITAFNVQPGATIKAGNVLAMIEPIVTEDALSLKLQGEIDLLKAQKVQVLETQALLQGQSAGLEQQLAQLTDQRQQLASQNQSINRAKVNAAIVALGQQKAQIVSAVAKAAAAKIDYERYAALAAEGVISQQKVSQVNAVWQAMEAEVLQTKAALTAAEAQVETIEREIPEVIVPTSDQQVSLSQNLQAQSAKMQTLTTEIASKQAQLTAYQADRAKNGQIKAIKALTDGVVYRTMAHVGESVSRTTPMVTFIDCKSRWIEALVPAGQANRINRSQPVQVMLSGKSSPVTGQVESISGVNPDELKRQPQAIVPVTPENLNSQIPARVVVKLDQPQSFPPEGSMCGVGQSVKLTFSAANMPQ
jgi:membrane fusion protein, multidrug efflux system